METLDTGMRTFSRIFSLSLSGKKIALQIGGMVCACIASLVILGLGGRIFAESVQWLITLLNLVVMVFIMFITWGAIAKVTVAEVAGLPAVDLKGAARAACKCATPLIIAPLKIVLIILIMMLAHVVCGWIGRIPVVGEIVWPFLAIPLFLLSALIVAAGLILLCGTLLLPSIIMVGKESPVSELNDFLRTHTLRFIVYLIATALVFAVVSQFFLAVTITDSRLSSWALGDKYCAIASSAPQALNRAFDRVAGPFRTPLQCSPIRGAEGACGPYACASSCGDLRWTFAFGGFIWGVFTLVIRLAILSLPFVIWSVSGTLIYLGLKPEAVPKA